MKTDCIFIVLSAMLLIAQTLALFGLIPREVTLFDYITTIGFLLLFIFFAVLDVKKRK